VNKVEVAYHPADLLEQRRPMMQKMGGVCAVRMISSVL
jgi:hypothetical protein